MSYAGMPLEEMILDFAAALEREGFHLTGLRVDERTHDALAQMRPGLTLTSKAPATRLDLYGPHGPIVVSREAP